MPVPNHAQNPENPIFSLAPGPGGVWKNQNPWNQSASWVFRRIIHGLLKGEPGCGRAV